MTERQAAILAYIEAEVGAGRPVPTVRELCAAVGIRSTSVTNYHLNKLRKAGYLTRTPAISRGLAIPGAVTVMPGADVVIVVDGREVVGAFAGLAA